jgi:hypothetical protein
MLTNRLIGLEEIEHEIDLMSPLGIFENEKPLAVTLTTDPGVAWGGFNRTVASGDEFGLV